MTVRIEEHAPGVRSLTMKRRKHSQLFMKKR
ncbi:UNVERIFIED_ORG: hypothetical protein M2328_004908 [Rhodococcus erythropolis]